MIRIDTDVRLDGFSAGEARFTQQEDGDCSFEWTRPDGVIERERFADLSQCSRYFAHRVRQWFARTH